MPSEQNWAAAYINSQWLRQNVKKKICEAQATSNLSLEKGIGQKIPHLAIKLLSTVIFWERERLFSLRV